MKVQLIPTELAREWLNELMETTKLTSFSSSAFRSVASLTGSADSSRFFLESALEPLRQAVHGTI